MMHGKHAMPITYGVHFVIGTCVRNHHYFLKLRNHNGIIPLKFKINTRITDITFLKEHFLYLSLYGTEGIFVAHL